VRDGVEHLIGGMGGEISREETCFSHVGEGPGMIGYFGRGVWCCCVRVVHGFMLLLLRVLFCNLSAFCVFLDYRPVGRVDDPPILRVFTIFPELCRRGDHTAAV
jgi:hypothetical protein